MSISIADTAGDFTRNLNAFAAQGGVCVVRYLTRFGGWKLVKPAEAQAIKAKGMKLALVYEDFGGTKNYSDINAASGKLHGEFAKLYAPKVGAPDGTIIWFAVDTDAHGAQISGFIVPYFRAIKEVFGDKFRVGIYGCGAACAACLDAGVCDAAWLANAVGWNGYQAFLKSARYTLLQRRESKLFGGIDPDEANGDYGGFEPWSNKPSFLSTVKDSKIAKAAVATGAAASGDLLASANESITQVSTQVSTLKDTADSIGITPHLMHFASNPRVWVALGIIVAVGCIMYWRWKDHA